MEHDSLSHSDSVQMDALTNGTLFTTSQWQCEDVRSYKWSTIHCLKMTVWRRTCLQMDHYSLPHSDSAKMYALTNEALFTASQWQCGDGRSYKWTTIHSLTVTVRRWKNLQMEHYLVPHNDSVEMDPLTNGPLFTASQWKCEDGRQYKWSTIHCLKVTVWRWTLLQMKHY